MNSVRASRRIIPEPLNGTYRRAADRVNKLRRPALAGCFTMRRLDLVTDNGLGSMSFSVLFSDDANPGSIRIEEAPIKVHRRASEFRDAPPDSHLFVALLLALNDGSGRWLSKWPIRRAMCSRESM